jgi:hypothetical protein
VTGVCSSPLRSMAATGLCDSPLRSVPATGVFNSRLRSVPAKADATRPCVRCPRRRMRFASTIEARGGRMQFAPTFDARDGRMQFGPSLGGRDGRMQYAPAFDRRRLLPREPPRADSPIHAAAFLSNRAGTRYVTATGKRRDVGLLNRLRISFSSAPISAGIWAARAWRASMFRSSCCLSTSSVNIDNWTCGCASWIVFRLEDHGQYALYRMNPDGGALHAILPLSSFKPRYIDWGPR